MHIQTRVAMVLSKKMKSTDKRIIVHFHDKNWKTTWEDKNMKKQTNSKRGYTKKELVKIIEKIDRDNHQQKMENDMQKPNSNNDNN